MDINAYLLSLTDWYQQTILVSPVWSAIGFGVSLLLAITILVLVIRAFFIGWRSIGRMIARQRRQNWQGYGLAIAPLSSGGKKTTKALYRILEEDLDQFLFGAPFGLIKAAEPKAKKRLGIRDVASKWLIKNDADLLIWGHRQAKRNQPIQLDILSREGALPASEARHSRVFLPSDFAKAPPLVHRITAYLVARALQPGLAQATAFKAEKIEAVAGILADALALQDAFPETTRSLLETDYCAMALHIGGQDHLDRVVTLRRKRLKTLETLPRDDQVAVHIDLGRALLALSEITFDPTQVREAMSHLKIAVAELRDDPTIKTATATSQAVQKGQSMLASRQRFSVTGGSGI